MKRIQRKRTKGWKMPLNAIYVGRPTKWGNPFQLDKETQREVAISAYEGWLRQKLRRDRHFLDPLKGKDLACWCPLDKPCHADVIIKILEAIK
jgi:hypothetical protein